MTCQKATPLTCSRTPRSRTATHKQHPHPRRPPPHGPPPAAATWPPATETSIQEAGNIFGPDPRPIAPQSKITAAPLTRTGGQRSVTRWLAVGAAASVLVVIGAFVLDSVGGTSARHTT